MHDQERAFPKELYDVYQNGKMRRYNLLFAVNGGAFAILEFSVKQGSGSTSPEILLPYLPWGLVIFTVIMFLDIWSFGRGMSEMPSLTGIAFTPLGMSILSIISALLVTGWLLLALQMMHSARMSLIFFVASVILLPAAGEPIRLLAGHRGRDRAHTN